MQNHNDTTQSQPPWIPLRAVVTPLLKDNLQYLSAFDAEFFEKIKNNQGAEELLLQEFGGFVRCKTQSDPSRWIFGENHPRQELAAIQTRLKMISRDAGLVIFLGTSTGYALRIAADALLKNPRTTVLVIEPSAARLRSAMLVFDMRNALASGRYHLAIGEDDIATVLQSINQYNLWGREKVYAYFSNPEDQQAKYHNFLDQYNAGSDKEHQKSAEVIECLRQNAAQKNEKTVERVMLFECWGEFPQGLHIRSIEKALRQRGVDVKTVALQGHRFDMHEADYRRFYIRSLLANLKDFQPDLIISYAYHAPQIVGQEIFEALGVPWVQAASNFAYYDRRYYQNEYSAIAERKLMPAYIERGAPNPFFVPIMANYSEDQPVQTSRRYPIVFVGNPLGLPKEDEQRFRTKMLKRSQLWNAILHAEQELSNFDLQLNLFDYLEANPMPQVENEQEYYDIFRYLLCQCTAARRRILLECIADKGLALFGNWADNAEDSALKNCYQRYLPIAEEPALFNEGHIFVNIHSVGNVTSPNMRYFNVAGMGGFLISDGDFSQFLEPGKEMIRYQSVNELAEQVTYYLEHIDEADRIREQGQKRIARQWTYSNWLDMIFEKVGLACSSMVGRASPTHHKPPVVN